MKHGYVVYGLSEKEAEKQKGPVYKTKALSTVYATAAGAQAFMTLARKSGYTHLSVEQK